MFRGQLPGLKPDRLFVIRRSAQFIGTYTTGTQPVAIGIDPSLNEYLYTANFLGNSVTGFQVNASTGALLNSQESPYGPTRIPLQLQRFRMENQRRSCICNSMPSDLGTPRIRLLQ